jgi:hypothetical protein
LGGGCLPGTTCHFLSLQAIQATCPFHLPGKSTTRQIEPRRCALRALANREGRQGRRLGGFQTSIPDQSDLLIAILWQNAQVWVRRREA